VSFDTRFILRRPLWAVAAAVGFLTRLPLGRRLELDAGDVARGALFFPLVGAGIGAAGGGIALLAHHRLSALLAAVLSVAVVVVLTGALHVDALADLADACGGATRKRRLEIMRDSRLGAYGTAALVLDLLVRSAAIEQLLVSGGVVGALVAAGALSRGAAVAAGALLPYPREHDGSGSVLAGRLTRPRAAAAAAIAVALAVLVAGWHGAVLAGGVAVSSVLLGAACRRFLGGATGDALGGISELGEIAALVGAAALA